MVMTTMIMVTKTRTAKIYQMLKFKQHSFMYLVLLLLSPLLLRLKILRLPHFTQLWQKWNSNTDCQTHQLIFLPTLTKEPSQGI